MDAINLSALPRPALLFVDTNPIVYWLERHPSFADRFRPLFEGHSAGNFRFAISTVTIAEVLAGPLRAGDETLTARYRAILESWRVVDLTADIAESAARIRASLRMKLPDAVQAASALAINADALVTHDRDFQRVTSLRIIA
jgi:predicted nucleic acid-binding protein